MNKSHFQLVEYCMRDNCIYVSYEALLSVLKLLGLLTISIMYRMLFKAYVDGHINHLKGKYRRSCNRWQIMLQIRFDIFEPRNARFPFRFGRSMLMTNLSLYDRYIFWYDVYIIKNTYGNCHIIIWKGLCCLPIYTYLSTLKLNLLDDIHIYIHVLHD